MVLQDIDSTSKVYFLQEVEDGRFEVYFGDGVLGEAIADGNIVILDYITCNRDEPNGATSFTLSGTIGGFSNVTITTLIMLLMVMILKQLNQLSIMHQEIIQHKIVQ